jgi:polysaccharide pyruvyl transferase WcaK-like protein
MRVALWNGSGLNNVGDHLIDAITRRELQARLPEAQFQSFSPWPGSFTQHRLTIDANGYWNAHGQFDVIVVGGGALIGGPPFLDPSNQFFLLGPYPERFQDSAPVLWNAMCSDAQTLAPTEERWRKFVCSAVSRISLLSVRNWRTHCFLRDCGVTAPMSVVPDVAVLAAEPAVRVRRQQRLRIGIAPGRPVFPQEFLMKIAAYAFSNMSTANPEVIRIVPYSPPAGFDDNRYAEELVNRLREIRDADLVVLGSDSMYGDAITGRLIAEKLGGATYVHLNDPLGADNIALLRSLDCVIVFRLHSAIMALTAGTPFIGVDIYRNEITGTSKLHQFIKESGFESRYLTLDDLVANPGRLANLVEDAAAQGSELVEAAHSRLASRARSHFDIMAQSIAAHAGTPVS